MADRDRHLSAARAWRLGGAVSALLLLLASSSCAGAPKPAPNPVKVERRGDTSSAAEADKKDAAAKPAEPAMAPAAPVAEQPAASKPGAPEPEKKNDATTIVIESGEPTRSSTVSMVEASRAEKERRTKPSRPVRVITNKTLSQYNKGKVTFAEPGGPRARADGGGSAAAVLLRERPPGPRSPDQAGLGPLPRPAARGPHRRGNRQEGPRPVPR
jgi:hypothetical protein